MGQMDNTYSKYIRFYGRGFCHHLVLLVGMDFSEEPAASVFESEENLPSRDVRDIDENFFSHTGGFYGEWSVRNTHLLMAVIGHISYILSIERNQIFTVANQFLHP
jgi:hypothetical protein